MTAEPDLAPAPTVRAVARVAMPPPPTVRATARVDGLVVRAAAPVRARGSASVPLRSVPPPDGERAVQAEDAPIASSARDVRAAEATPTPVRKKWSAARRALLPVSVAAVAAFVAATGYLAVTEPGLDPDVGRWSAAGATAPAPAAGPSWNRPATAGAQPFGAAAPQPQGPPTRLRVRAIGVDTALESLHLGGDGALTPPKDFAEAGWYADGTAPGDQGPAVIAGHVDSRRGPAVFYRLRELQAGDRIEVVRGRAVVAFTVVSLAWYPKTAFPTEEVYGPTPDRQLRLITCGGVFDHHLRSYTDNLVVYAVGG